MAAEDFALHPGETPFVPDALALWFDLLIVDEPCSILGDERDLIGEAPIVRLGHG